MATTQTNKELVRRYYEIFQEEDFDALEEVLTSEAFPDMTATMEKVVAEGDMVAYRATITATHEGEFMGIPPTGEEVSVDGEGFFRIEDGKLAEAWPLMDTLGMLQQLGVVEPPGE